MEGEMDEGWMMDDQARRVWAAMGEIGQGMSLMITTSVERMVEREPLIASVQSPHRRSEWRCPIRPESPKTCFACVASFNLLST